MALRVRDGGDVRLLGGGLGCVAKAPRGDKVGLGGGRLTALMVWRVGAGLVNGGMWLSFCGGRGLWLRGS